MSVDKLIHRMWDDSPPAKARDALHVHMSRIRALLRPVGRDAPPILSDRNAYTLGVDPDRVDLRRYVNLVDRAASLADSRDDEGAARLLAQAAKYSAGEPLTGISAYWADRVRALIGEKNLNAARVQAGILVGKGRFDEAVPLLTPLIEDFPTDEKLVEYLALALYGSRRAAEAAQLLHRTQRRIVRDSGIAASARLRRIQQGILSGTPVVTLVRQKGDAARARSSAHHHAGQPSRDVPWVGRQEELRRLTEALSEGGRTSAPRVSVEAIDGMGGVGKTALAVHAAHILRENFPDGRLILPLRGHAPGDTPLTTTRALTELLRLVDAPRSLPESVDELISLWRTTLRDRRMIVILDDASGPDQVRPLLPGASPTAIVVTSRRRLTGLPGVRPISLDVLPRDDAIALFGCRLGTRRGARASHASDTAELVQLCDRLPLAIEILASRLLAHPSWDTSDLFRQVAGEGRLSEMRDGERTVTGVLSLSYRALTPVQQLVFRRVALHFGSEFDSYAATALTGLTFDETEQALEDLLSRSLIQEPSPHRFTIHDLLRAYARTLVGQARTGGSSDQEIDSEEEAEHSIRRLVDYYQHVADLADSLAYPFRLRIAGRAVAAPTTPRPKISDTSEAERWLAKEGAAREAREISRSVEDPQLESECLHQLAMTFWFTGQYERALPMLERSLQSRSNLNDRLHVARSQNLLGVISLHLDRPGAATSYFQRAFLGFTEAGDIRGRYMVPNNISESHQKTGNHEDAERTRREAIKIAGN